MNYYPHHIGDYARDTAHLSMLEDAAYRRMLDVYYASEKPLPKSKPSIYRLVRAKSKAEHAAVDVVLTEFFAEGPDGWRNRRADSELTRAREKSDKARGSAAKRWHSEGNANASANAMRTQSEGNAPNNQEPRTSSQDGAVDVDGLSKAVGDKYPDSNKPRPVRELVQATAASLTRRKFA